MKIYHVCMAALAACALLFITACDSSELENSFAEQKQVEAKESVLTSKTRSGGIDKGRPIPWRVDPDTLPHRIRPLMVNAKQTLSSNLFALNGKSFRIKSVYKNKYIYAYATDEEVGFNEEHQNIGGTQYQFTIKSLPASSGIPYLIYSLHTNTYIGIGFYDTDEWRDDKIVLPLPNNEGSLYSAGWDIFPATDTQGRNKSNGAVVIESQSHLGTDANGIFYHVWESRDNNCLRFGKYAHHQRHEFIIEPIGQCKIKSIEWDKYSAKITKNSDEITTYIEKNPDPLSEKLYDFEIKHPAKETSRFVEQQGIKFDVTGNLGFIAHPVISEDGWSVSFPNSTSTRVNYDTTRETSYTHELRASMPYMIPPASMAICEVAWENYTVEVDYNLIADYDGKDVRISGTWRGKLYSGKHYLDIIDEPM